MNVPHKVSLGVLTDTGLLLQPLQNADLPMSVVIANRTASGSVSAGARGVGVPFEAVYPRWGICIDILTPSVIAILKQYNAGLVVVSGFRSSLGQQMYTPETFGGRVLFSHRTVEPGQVTCAIYVVISADRSLVLAQEIVCLAPGQTTSEFDQTVRKKETELYLEVIRQSLRALPPRT